MKDIVTDLKTLAEAVPNSYVWIHGPVDYANYELTKKTINTGKFIFILLPVIDVATSIVNASQVNTWEIELQIFFGLKTDKAVPTTAQTSTLDELYSQKYTKRLYTLKSTFKTFLESFLCSTVYQLQSLRIVEQVNRFDENADFVNATLRLRYDDAD